MQNEEFGSYCQREQGILCSCLELAVGCRKAEIGGGVMQDAQGMFSVSESDIEMAEKLSSGHGQHKPQVFCAVLAAVLVERLWKIAGAELHTPLPKLKAMAVTEFFAKLRPALDVDKVLGAAYFLQAIRDVSAFTSEALRACLLEGRVKPPTNVSLAALANSKKGMLAPTGKKEAGKISWFITQSGMEAIEARLRSVEERQD